MYTNSTKVTLRYVYERLGQLTTNKKLQDGDFSRKIGSILRQKLKLDTGISCFPPLIEATQNGANKR